MTVFEAVIAIVALQRAGELILARANTARLLRQGAIEIDRGGYKWIVLLHAAWLAALITGIPHATPPNWPLLAVFCGLQAGRVWVITSLGRRWTTRVIVLAGTSLVTAGPYRYFRHPNYAIVAAEVAILPLAFAAVSIAVAFSACNALLLLRRIRIEQAALGIPSYHNHETLPRRS